MTPPSYGAAASGATFSLVFSSTANAASGTIVNYGTMTYASGATRIVAANQFYSSSITGITIGGVALTQVTGAAVTASSITLDVWESAVPLAGTFGTVIVTYATSLGFNSSISLYSLTTTTPAGTGTHASVGSTTLSISPTVPTGGGGIILAGSSNGTALTGLTNTTIDTTQTVNGINNVYAHTTFTGTSTVTSTYGAGDQLGLSAVVWSP